MSPATCTGSVGLAGQHVEREAQALVAVERVAPARRLVAVHHGQEFARRAPRRFCLDLARERERAWRGPTAARRRRAHQPAAHDRHASRAQPVEPGLAVRVRRGCVERVARWRLRTPAATASRCRSWLPSRQLRRRRRGRAAGAASRSDCGPRLTRSPSTWRRSRDGEKPMVGEQLVERRRSSPGGRLSDNRIIDSATLAGFSAAGLWRTACTCDAPRSMPCLAWTSPFSFPDRAERRVRDVGNGADREPQGAPAGDARSGRLAAPRQRSTCTTTPPSSCRRCRWASPRSAS